MRKIFTILFALSSIFLTAQSVSLTTTDSIHIEDVAVTADTIFEHKTYVESEVFSEAQVKWEIDSSFYPSEWTVSLCDNAFCLDLEFADNNIFTLAPGAQSELKMGYSPNEKAGTAYIRVKIKTEGTTDEYLYMVYTAKLGVEIPSSISNVDASSLKIFPNPVIENMNINFDSSLDLSTASIYNVIGKKVKTATLGSNQNILNTSDLEKGIYVIKLYSKDQSLFHTQTFVKK